MDAWRFVKVGTPLELMEVEEPAAGPGEVVLDVMAAGVCHTDVGIVDGSLSHIVGYRPISLGHEVAGRVRELGEGVTALAVGDSVAVRSSPTGPGISRDGGFQPVIAVQSHLLVPVPAGVNWDQAAVSTDAGMTSYRAVAVAAGVGPGQRVGIIGFGGLGSLGSRIAQLAGAEVFVAEVRTEMHGKILESGVVAVSTHIEDFIAQQLDAIVDFAGVGTTTASAVATVRPRGRVVQVGHSAQYGTLDLMRLTLDEVTLVGTLGGDNEDNARVLKLMSAGLLSAATERISFDGISDALGRLGRGEVSGRLVVCYS